MNTCANCGKPTELTKSGRRYRKHCSGKCANQYWRKKHQKPKDPNKGLLTRQRAAAKKKRADDLAWHRENWLTATQIAEILGIHSSGIHHRAKKLNIPGKLVAGNFTFWPPEAVEQLKYKETPIPEGYMTREEACDYIGYSKATFETMRVDYGHPKHIEWQETHGHKATRHLYKKEDLDEWMTSVKEKRRQKREEDEKQRQKRREAKQKAKEVADKKFQKQISELLTSEEAAKVLGLKVLSSHQQKIPRQKIRARYYYKPEDVEAYRKQREAELAKKTQEKEQAHAWKLRKTDWQDPKQYEIKILRKIRARRLPKNHSNISIYKNIKFNKEWKRGNVIKLECDSCEEQLPFYDFYVRWDSHRARDIHCKLCLRDRTIKNQKTSQHQESITTKIRRIVGISIKSHIRRNRGEYPEEIDMKLMWQKLKQHCGYDQFDLKKHIEAQFSDNMTWDSWGRADKAKREGFAWNIDHIIPKSSFYYTNLDDPDFKECWKLDNLRPLGAVLNSVRGDKDLIDATRSSFRNGIINTKSECKSGIWSYLPYTPSEAREYIESMFDSTMSWTNYGPDWHIDHIVPIAFLSYDSMEHPNFQKAWALSNLQPLPAAKNLSKGSFFNDVIWVYKGTTVFSDNSQL